MDINKTQEYTPYVNKLGVEITSSSNGYYQGMRSVVHRTSYIGEFIMTWNIQNGCYGTFKMDICALLEYEMGGKIYLEQSPKTDITFHIQS